MQLWNALEVGMRRLIFFLLFLSLLPVVLVQGAWEKSDVTLPDDLRRLIDFHGHLCSGLVKGYKAVHYARERLQSGDFTGADLTPVVENQKCGVDAIQFLLTENSRFGNTWGNGFKGLVMFDYGKDTWIFIRMEDKSAVRLSLVPGVLDAILEDAPDSGSFNQMRMRYMRGFLPTPLAAKFISMMEKKTLEMLAVPYEKMFKIDSLPPSEVKSLMDSFPAPASRIPKRFICAICNEGVINYYNRSLDGLSLCIPCYERELKKQKTSPSKHSPPN